MFIMWPMFKNQALPLFMAVTLLCSVAFTVSGCAAMKHELGIDTAQTATAQTNQPGAPIFVPLSNQLQTVAPIVQQVIPEPWSTLISSVLNIAATGAAAFATFHARRAAASSATAASFAITTDPKPVS